MKFRKLTVAAIITATFGSSITVNAQSYNPYQYDRNSDFRGTINLTIPFSGGRDAKEHDPQLHLGFQQRTHMRDDFTLLKRYNVKSSLLEHQPPQVRIGFTLSEKPKFLVNDSEVKLPENGNGISTLAIVGIGVGIATLAGLALYADALSDSSGGE